MCIISDFLSLPSPSALQTGMTRDEVTAIRLYFARSVDRYIERRRVMIRASQRLRNSLNDIVGSGSSSQRQRSNTGESTNSLLDTEEGADNATSERGDNNTSSEGGGNNTNSNAGNGNEGSNNNTDNADNTTFEGEEVLNDRFRMEDEWMSTQVRDTRAIYQILFYFCCTIQSTEHNPSSPRFRDPTRSFA